MRKIKLPGSRFKVTSGIYLITCLPTGDTYVGRSKNLNQRWCQHRSDLRAGTHNNPHIQRLYNEHGSKSFTMALLELVEDKDALETVEVRYIKELAPTLNVTDTKLSKTDVEQLRIDILSLTESEVAIKYNISIKYLKEILRGGKWSN